MPLAAPMSTPDRPRCLICGSAALPHLARDGYQLYRCGLCGFMFVWPTPAPAELADYYARTYAVPRERYAAAIASHARRIADLERWMPERGRLLEVGASYGHGLAIARARGWQVAGVELSPEAAACARAHFRLEVFAGDLLDAPFAEESFDAAVMWHVLEHTHDPRAQLGRVLRLLRPGGVLGVRVPNIASFGARVAGRSWAWLAPPAHLWYFSPATLPRLLAQLGFEVVEVATLRGDGTNPYQHALIGAGARLRAWGSLLRGRRSTVRTSEQGLGVHPSPWNGDQHIERRALNVSLVRRAWAGLLRRMQPATEALAQLTAPALERFEAAGWGDELLVYARR
jgi:SAM-dependent methyltransferase